MELKTEATPEVVRVLSETLANFTGPERWTSGAYARDGLGEKVGPLDPDAVCHCLDGMLYRTAGHDFSEARAYLSEYLYRIKGQDEGIIGWNDCYLTLMGEPGFWEMKRVLANCLWHAQANLTNTWRQP